MTFGSLMLAERQTVLQSPTKPVCMNCRFEKYCRLVTHVKLAMFARHRRDGLEHFDSHDCKEYNSGKA